MPAAFVETDPIVSECEHFGYSPIKTIATGTFGVVKLATAMDKALDRRDRLATDVEDKGNSMVAVKVIHTDVPPEKEYVNEIAQRELHALQRLDHPHVMYMYEYFDSPERMYFVLEYYGLNGRLGDFIRQYRAGRGLGLPEGVVRHFTRQLVDGLKYVHMCGIVHRDLTPENILLDDKYNLKISGFGLSTRLEKGCRLIDCYDVWTEDETTAGSLEYTAPEAVCQDECEGKPADVWSLGVVFYLMLMGERPYTVPYDKDPTVRCQLYIKNVCHVELIFNKYTSKEAKKLARYLLASEWMRRPTMKQLSPWGWLKNAVLSPDRVERYVRKYREQWERDREAGNNVLTETDPKQFFQTFSVPDKEKAPSTLCASPEVKSRTHDDNADPEEVRKKVHSHHTTPHGREKVDDQVQRQLGHFQEDSTSDGKVESLIRRRSKHAKSDTKVDDQVQRHLQEESTSDGKVESLIRRRSKHAKSDSKWKQSRSRDGREKTGNSDTTVVRTDTEENVSREQHIKKKPSEREFGTKRVSPPSPKQNNVDTHVGMVDEDNAYGDDFKTNDANLAECGKELSGHPRRGRKFVPMAQKDVGSLVEGANFVPKAPPVKKASVAEATPSPGQRPSSRAQMMKRERSTQYAESSSSSKKLSKKGRPSQNVEESRQQEDQMTPDKACWLKQRTPSPCSPTPPERLTRVAAENSNVTNLGDGRPSLRRSTHHRRRHPDVDPWEAERGDGEDGVARRCRSRIRNKPRNDGEATWAKRRSRKNEGDASFRTETDVKLRKDGSYGNARRQGRQDDKTDGGCFLPPINGGHGHRTTGLLPPIDTVFASDVGTSKSLRNKNKKTLDDMRERRRDSRLRLPPIIRK